MLTGRWCLRLRHQKSPSRSAHWQIKLRTMSVKTLVVLLWTIVWVGDGKREKREPWLHFQLGWHLCSWRAGCSWDEEWNLCYWCFRLSWTELCSPSLYCGSNPGAWYLELGPLGSKYVEMKSWPSWLLPWLPWRGTHFCSVIHAVYGTASHLYLWPPPSWIQLARSRKWKNTVSWLNR